MEHDTNRTVFELGRILATSRTTIHMRYADGAYRAIVTGPSIPEAINISCDELHEAFAVCIAAIHEERARQAVLS